MFWDYNDNGISVYIANLYYLGEFFTIYNCMYIKIYET